jgi:hypothetical protein
VTLLYSRADPVQRRRTEIIRDSETGLPLIMRVSHDPTQILDENKRWSNAFDHAAAARKNPAGMVRVASVPKPIYNYLKMIGLWDDKPRLMRFLDQPENLWLRTDGGRRLS